MSIDLQDLSDDHVVRLTKLLCRRPEYGVAVPSKRWLQRQEERMKNLPSLMLRPTNPFKRLAMKIADTFEPDLIDPQAVLCKTHASLNPWLIRRVFLALAYEATVHSDPLRSWEGRMGIPTLSAFISRVDAIAALWTEPRLFRECYGVPPFDSHKIYVRSGCEACILGAVGASGQILADLRALVVDRIERRQEAYSGHSPRDPRLGRLVEAWVDHLRSSKEERDRAQACRAMSEEVLTELRAVRPQIREWRRRQKKSHRHSRALKRSGGYTELRRTSTGRRLSHVPSNARHSRRTKHGIPVAMADREGAEDQRRAGLYRHFNTASIYRPDSLCDFSEVGRRQQAARSMPVSRLGAPQPARLSGPSDGEPPTQSFIEGFEREFPVESDESDPYDYDYDYDDDDDEPEELAERDLDKEEMGRSKVSDWYANRFAETHEDLAMDDTVMSMIHPAFQTGSIIAPSAVPAPLQLKKDRDDPREEHSPNRRSDAWTDATVYTVDQNTSGVGTGPREDAQPPPVPRVPSRYRDHGHDGTDRERTPRPKSVLSRRTSVAAPPPPSSRTPRQSSVDRPRRSTSPLIPVSEPVEAAASTSTPTRSSPPLNWPAPPPASASAPPPSGPMGKPSKKYLFLESDAGSRLSVSQREYLKSCRGMRDYRPEDNPFTRAGSRNEGPGTPMSPTARTFTRAGSRNEGGGTPVSPTGGRASASSARTRTQTPGANEMNQASSSSRASHTSGSRGSRVGAAVPSLSSSHGNTIDEEEGPRRPVDCEPRRATAEDEKAWREAWGARDDQSDFQNVLPDDSISNVMCGDTA
ncbi:Uu.00g060240.m01.CDS01 [Anthostomella pinea]|uniref:Uu.00g060240.m01.CDS01 n=1 Tax=Anthostomella pinea TaxID=933095 RepID=A0AAI8VT19_9PEZI|nr:Uu.00g060240.m01.CDS01 [Anthostomella pinea]